MTSALAEDMIEPVVTALQRAVDDIVSCTASAPAWAFELGRRSDDVLPLAMFAWLERPQGTRVLEAGGALHAHDSDGSPGPWRLTRGDELWVQIKLLRSGEAALYLGTGHSRALLVARAAGMASEDVLLRAVVEPGWPPSGEVIVRCGQRHARRAYVLK